MSTNAGNQDSHGKAFTHNHPVTMTRLLTEQDAAALLKMSVKSLQGWRYRGAGPRFVKAGRSVRYRPEDLQTFVLAALRTSTSDPGANGQARSRIRVEPFLEKTGRTLSRMEAASSIPPGKVR